MAENKEQKERIMLKYKYYFDKSELKNLYKGWNIIFYEEELGGWETHGEPRHRHYKVRMIAQKP